MAVLDQISGPPADTELLASLEQRWVFLWVHSEDGNISVMVDGNFKPVDGAGDRFIFGQVIDTGVEDWGTGLEPYLVLNVPDEPTTMITVGGIQQGYFGHTDSLHRLVKAAFTGNEEMEHSLEAAGFQTL